MTVATDPPAINDQPQVQDQPVSQNPETSASKAMAPIKKEYLTEPTNNNNKEKDLATTETNSPTPKDQAKPSGQHKNRRHQNKNKAHQQPTSSKLCVKISQGQQCPYNDTCTFSHDVAKYLQTKEPDLGPRCVFFDTYGQCRYGLRCRFANAHTDKEHKQMVDEEKVEKKPVYAHNDFSRDLMIQLRKKEIGFERSVEFNKSYGQDDVTKPGSRDEEEPRAKRTRVPRGSIDYRGKTYLAPLTTVGNLPFRRICKQFGVDITCSEMALASNLLQGQQSEWALLKRHSSETLFGIQLAGNKPDTLGRAAELVSRECLVDFIDINMGCPIDMAYNTGGGSALLAHPSKIQRMVQMLNKVTDCDVTVKIRTGINSSDNLAHLLVPKIESWGASLVTVHGRSRQQRYTKYADWQYIGQCRQEAVSLPVFGGGDVLSWEDYWAHLETHKQADGVMIGRGALIKPWVFKEINERRVWDISSSERLDILRDYAHHAMEHWGTDTQGIDNVRRYLLEWQSFLHRYIPAGLLEVLPQRMNDRPPAFVGRNELETLMASDKVGDWIKLSEMVLGPAPENFTFVPKHKSNSYA
ncbi:tRNA-dihydrouridine(47) synthase [NAD(P)(+)]-like protein [Coemansia sp. RSA 1722]|nr:tRNA-dihydrouridine(47) synthase [NAD(P)(+)]-like protein [Coemansia sp. RSA 486]KAJ2236454.1 tRNA-dihydrouridine(47) synthase [NAD(P)(+)]-like protein [Coemansia sp. RSA 485]KAJ2604295.1 tRNA-dihydrouridine(47) synthase [NAD(P)(+)]-like protein [Coemansia sp. RSA 1722]